MPGKAKKTRSASSSVVTPTEARDGHHAKPYHHGDLRNALIEAGVRLIGEKGPGGFSLREAARAAGVSHTAPYRHFADRQALLEAVAADGFLALAEAMEKAAADNPGDPVTQLRQAGRSYIVLAVRNPEKTMLMFGGVVDFSDCGDELRDAGRRAFEGLYNIVENGRRAGIYGERDSMTLSLSVWSHVHGLSMLYTGGQLGPSTEIPDEKGLLEMAEAIGEILWNGLIDKEALSKRSRK